MSAVLTGDTANLLRALAHEIADAARASTVAPERRLWTAAACAEYLGYGRSHFRQHIVARPDFPVALQIGGGREGRRWKASEVIAWAEARRIKE